MPIHTTPVSGFSKEGSAPATGFVTLSEGTNITLTQTGNDVEISGPAGAGEANTSSNVGTGEGTLAKAKVGVDLPFKSLKQGANITVTNNADDVTIAASGGDVSAAWPIGSVFIAVVSTNPATLLGFGTWSAFGAGRVLVGRDAGDTDFDTAEETGGAKTQTPSAHSGTAVADHASHTHTYTQVPNHVHALSTILRTATTGAATTHVAQATDTSSTADTTRKTDNPDGGVATGTTNGPSATLTHGVTQPSDHAAMSVVQPYIVVYMWKRTA